MQVNRLPMVFTTKLGVPNKKIKKKKTWGEGGENLSNFVFILSIKKTKKRRTYVFYLLLQLIISIVII